MGMLVAGSTNRLGQSAPSRTFQGPLPSIEILRSNSAPNRVPPGVPTGGQFAPINRPEATGAKLVDNDTANPVSDVDVDAFLADRRERIRAGGDVSPAAAPRASVDPRSSAYVHDWWEAEHATAEYGNEAGAYPQMPDDYTPSQGLGNALSGHRRTHRMAYSGAGVSMRMPRWHPFDATPSKSAPAKAARPPSTCRSPLPTPAAR